MNGWKRSRGVFDRPASARPSLRYVNDGGRDAPMDPASNRFWWAVTATIGVLVLGGSLVVLIVD